MRTPRHNSVHYTFEGGEADPQYERRADADLWGLTAKRLRNVRLLTGGGAKRRPGLARALALSGTARLVPFTSNDGTKWLLAFRNGATDVIDTSEAVDHTVSTTGIATADLPDFQWTQNGESIVVAGQGFYPKKFSYSGGTFTSANFPFFTDADGKKFDPHYRFADTKGITLTPSATTGSITVTASANLFTAGWASNNIRFRILGQELYCTAYASPTSITATVVNPLYPTRRYTVASTSGFTAGDIVRTSVEEWQFEVASIVSGTQIDLISMDSFADATTTSNNLEGPNAVSAISAVGAASAEGASVQWTEQLISAVRGYPGAVCLHKQRLIFADFPQAPELHAMSVIGLTDDFDPGEGLDDEGITDGPGDSVGRRVRHIVSSEQLLTFSEAGSYYIGEGPSTPLTPSNVEFLRIGPESAGDCNPVMCTEGAVFNEATADRLMLLAPTGQLRRVWGATEILSTASEILVTPTRLALADGSDLGPERYLFALNSDGTLCVTHFRRDNNIAGACLWSTANGSFVDVAVFNGKVYTVVNRSSSYTLERFDEDRLLDNSVLFTNTSPATPTNAAFVSRSNVALVWRKTAGGEARRVELGTLYTGDGSGVLTGAPTNTRDYEGGDRFDVTIEPWSPITSDTGVGQFMRVSEVAVDILNSGLYYTQGQSFTAYRAADDVTEPPPLRSGWRRRGYLAVGRDFNFQITQTEAAPLHVRQITMKVR